MKRFTEPFIYIFSDDEWFNKILIGGFCLILIPLGIGLIMINGYLLSFSKDKNNKEKQLPFWRNYKSLFTHGLRTGIISYFFMIAAVIFALTSGHSFSIVEIVAYTSLFLTFNSLLIVKTLNMFGVLCSVFILVVTISLGWMFIVVGWPLLIFLAMLVQVYLFSK